MKLRNKHTKFYKLSSEGMDALLHEEGYRNRLYLDSQGYPTIGVGHLLTPVERKYEVIVLSSGEKIGINTEWTKSQVTQLLEDDLTRFYQAVNTISTFINQGQFDALVSFAFNIGVAGFLRSTAVKRIKAGKHYEVPNAMLMWNKPVEIRNRRRREADMYARNTNDSTA